MKKRWAEYAGLAVAPFLSLMALEAQARGGVAAFFAWMVRQPLMFGMNGLFLLGVCLMISRARSRRVQACLWLLLNLLCATLGMANY